MGKKDKEHRAKVAKRNRRVAQEKSGMQKVFDKLMEEQIQKLKNSEGLNVDLSGNTVPFEVFDKSIHRRCFISISAADMNIDFCHT